MSETTSRTQPVDRRTRRLLFFSLRCMLRDGGMAHMRMSVLYIWFALADAVIFVGFWAVQTLTGDAGAVPSLGVQSGFWITALLGMALSVYGFTVLARSRGNAVTRPVVVVLLSLSPACGALIRLLTLIGSNPVGR